MMYGTMETDVKLLGIGLTLNQGQRVHLTEPTNLPPSDKIRWFAAPADGRWPDGIDRNRDDSILIDHDDVDPDPEFIPHPSQQLSCFV